MSAGKGDKPRSVNRKKFDKNFEDIFGEKPPFWVRKKRGKNKKKKVDNNKKNDIF